MKTKTISQSSVSIGNLMQPEQANLAGNVHGGDIMKLMDNAAGIVAYKHAHTNVVTARVDQLEFHQPIHIGNLVTCKGRLSYVGNSSMEVQVTVYVEDLMKDEPAKKALTAFFTMVALDDGGNPQKVPALTIENPEEEKVFEEGKRRYQTYKEKKKRGQS